MASINFSKLPTEKSNSKSRNLDSLSVQGAVRLMIREDAGIHKAVAREKRAIEKAIRLVVASLRANGRIYFVGAGTSGRLGVLESAELPPTFSTPPSLAQAIMAGGKKAVFRSQEGAEDSAEDSRRQVRAKVRKGDVVIGIAASGVTPFARAALDEGKKKGATTIFVTCAGKHSKSVSADVVIAPLVGPEIITGSTRLKSGTATKMVLNMITTVSMVQIGKVYGNRMVDLQAKSLKLRERGIRLVEEFTRLDRKTAEGLFKSAGGNAKTAIVMAKLKVNAARARRILEQSRGFLRQALSAEHD